MKIGTSLLILLLAIIALLAEAVLYFLLGIGAAFSGNISQVGGIAYFFVSVMIMTLALGVTAPVCAFIEASSKKANVGYKILLAIQGVLVLFLVGVHQIRNQFDPGSEKQKLAQSVKSPMKIASGPFGLSKGMSKSEIQKSIRLEANEKYPNRYVTLVVPLPHESFVGYTLLIDPSLGLCSIEAQGKSIQTNSQGDSLRFEFNKLKAILREKYGPISDDVDELKQGSIFQSPGSWMLAMTKGERQLMASWESKGNTQLGNDLSAVALIALADSMYAGTIGIIYEFENAVECKKNLEKVSSKAL